MQALTTTAGSVETLVHDTFGRDVGAGKVIGSRVGEFARLGVDIEGVLSVDGGALRIRPNLHPEWGRSALAYGPFPRQNGLVFATLVLNGHNSSQTGNLAQGIKTRYATWLRGSRTHSPLDNLSRWVKGGKKRRTIEHFGRWHTIRRKSLANPTPLDENLAIGFFPEAVVVDPRKQGQAFVMQAAEHNNGELQVRCGAHRLPVMQRVTNVPILYLMVLREMGTAYYAATLGEDGTFSNAQLLAIDPWQRSPEVYAAIHQSVLGQIGFRVDTRVYEAQVAQVHAWDNWYGTALLADSLQGDSWLGSATNGVMAMAQTETGQSWEIHSGRIQRSAKGTVGTAFHNFTSCDLQQPLGLYHTLIDCTEEAATATLYWRMRDTDNCWALTTQFDQTVLRMRADGEWHDVAATNIELRLNQTNSLQIRDDGQQINVTLNGRLLFVVDDTFLSEATRVGFGVDDRCKLHHLEAHGRQITLPAALVPASIPVPAGETLCCWDEFGKTGELHQSHTTKGDRRWERTLGKGQIICNEQFQAKVLASVETPNPGRTLYTIDWKDPVCADLQVDITPPGTGRNEGEKGRGGFVFWQDEDNYLVINTWLDDYYAGASMSSFLMRNGYEELYDAVWVNIGDRITWGEQYRLRAAFDGMTYVIYVNDEPVLYRALTDIYPDCERYQIRRVGLAVNWEWGDDTGSVFENFVAKRG